MSLSPRVSRLACTAVDTFRSLALSLLEVTFCSIPPATPAVSFVIPLVAGCTPTPSIIAPVLIRPK